jgi:tetratricopeptide (TPR) repeat protein
MRDEAGAGERVIFVSRAGGDAEIAARVVDALEAAGYRTILQQRNFRHANFIKKMHDALQSGARVVALLSPEYLRSEYCQAEWMNAIAGDPLNERRRLIVLRVAECEAPGLLAGIDHTDLTTVLDDPRRLAQAVVDAVRTGEEPRAVRAPGIESGSIGPVPSFTGRERELDEVERALRAGPLAVVHGMGGTGKSSLAKEYAWRHRGRYSVVWLVPAETEDGIIDALVRFGAEFDPSPRTVADRRADARRVLASFDDRPGDPALLIFDNVPDESVLHAWRPGAAARVLATSRSSAWARSVRTVPLGLWPRDDSITYLRQESGRADLAEADAAEIAKRLGDLPLAVAHAAAYLKRTKTVGAANYLARLDHHMAQAPKGADYPRSVFATFREAIAQAEEHAPGSAALAALASFFAPDAIPEELFHDETAPDDAELRPQIGGTDSPLDLASALGDPSRVAEALGELDQLSLILFDPADRTFSMHRLVQSAAREPLADDVDAWALRAVRALSDVFPRDPQNFANWPACERLLTHARSALEHVSSGVSDMAVATLADGVGNYLHERAAFVEAESLHRRALTIVETLYSPPHRVIASVLNNLGSVLGELGRLAESREFSERALAMWEALQPDSPSLAVSLNNLADLYRAMGRLSEAEAALRRVITIDEKHYGSQHPEVATDLNNLGVVLTEAQRPQDAETALQRALEIDTENFGENHPNTARDLENLALALRELGRHDEAAAMGQRAVIVYERVNGSYYRIANALGNLGLTLVEAQRFGEAAECLQRAIARYEAVRGPGTREALGPKRVLLNVLTILERHAEADELRAQIAEMTEDEG